jgi:putative Mg2+ transporter-C (MgtC) family protein
MILDLIISAVLGAIIGLEREYTHKTAGLRTHILVCMGSTLFTLMSVNGFGSFISTTSYDPSRIIAAILVGVGFIGAGTIIKHGAGVKGLTTAASLWITAGIGIAVGLGFYILAVFAAFVSIVVLLLVIAHPHLQAEVKKKK